eukprot:symbB.v1.2.031624.t1/scaffold3690.1/size51928/1
MISRAFTNFLAQTARLVLVVDMGVSKIRGCVTDVPIEKLIKNSVPYQMRGWCLAEIQWSSLRSFKLLKLVIIYGQDLWTSQAPLTPDFFRKMLSRSEVHFTHRVDLEPLIKAQKAAFEAKAKQCTILKFDNLPVEQVDTLSDALPHYSTFTGKITTLHLWDCDVTVGNFPTNESLDSYARAKRKSFVSFDSFLETARYLSFESFTKRLNFNESLRNVYLQKCGMKDEEGDADPELVLRLPNMTPELLTANTTMSAGRAVGQAARGISKGISRGIGMKEEARVVNYTLDISNNDVASSQLAWISLLKAMRTGERAHSDSELQQVAPTSSLKPHNSKIPAWGGVPSPMKYRCEERVVSCQHELRISAAGCAESDKTSSMSMPGGCKATGSASSEKYEASGNELTHTTYSSNDCTGTAVTTTATPCGGGTCTADGSALEAALLGRTSFAIAHRLTTIQGCDMILVNADGPYG